MSLDAANQLVLKESTKEVKCDVSSELALSQALCRRSLAFDLVGVASYDKLEAWSRHLMHHLQMEPPPSYAKVGVDQILRADKQAFLRMAEFLPKGLKRDPAGVLPLHACLDKIYSDPSVQFHLLPLPGSRRGDAMAANIGAGPASSKVTVKDSEKRQAHDSTRKEGIRNRRRRRKPKGKERTRSSLPKH